MKKLEDTRNIPDGRAIRIYKKGFGYATVTTVATHEMFIAFQGDVELLSAVTIGDTLECYLWVEDVASYDFVVEIIGLIPAEPWIIFCKNTENITKNKERRCLGAKSDLPIKFFIFNPSDVHKGLRSETVVFHYGRVIWLEDREAIIKTDFSIQDDTFIKGHVQIDEQDTEIVGNVNALNREKNIYNIVFTGELTEDRNRILGYIFKTYRE